jgi:molybdopterin/thiamine biosynthesis adenylyltransferase
MPARLEWELECCRAADLEVEAAQEDDLWEFRFSRRFRGTDEPFRIIFGAYYPDMPPGIAGRPELLRRHQNPISGGLCLVDGEDSWWRPTRSCVEMVHQLDRLLAATEAGDDAVAAGEAPMAEPITGHLAFDDERAVLVPQALLEDELGARAGTFRLRRINDNLFVVTELLGDDGRRAATAEPGVLELTRDAGALGGWIELETTPEIDGLLDALRVASARALDHRSTKAGKRAKGNKQRARPRRRSNYTGITFFEEGDGRRDRRRTWVFAETEIAPNGDAVWVGGRPIRAQAISSTERAKRLLELDGLATQRALLIGAGSVAAEIAAELAKAGVGRLDIVDRDDYDPGNAVRHLLPVTRAGQPKAKELASLCEGLNPFADVNGWPVHIGLPGGDPRAILELFDEADLVVEATGSHAVLRVCQRRANEVGVPVVSAALTIGGWGGRVVALQPAGPCWDCFLLQQGEGEIPVPETGPRNDQTPFGCSHPAASCAGFDVTHVGAVASRMSIQALRATKYPELDHDWVVLNFRPGAIPVQTGVLAAHPDCPNEH